MNWWEILIAVTLALFAIITIVISILKKKRGKTDCGCNCGSCPYNSGCQGSDKGKNKTSF